MTSIDQLPETRRAVLRFLKDHGSGTLARVADALEMTREGARQQLLQLQLAGLVHEDDALRGGKAGRPAAVFKLTSDGEHLFPKRYDTLAVTLIDAVGELGPDATRQVMGKLVDAKVDAWEPRLAGKTPREKALALRAFYLEEDGFMEVQEDGADLLLIERNCPFLQVAKERPVLCSVSVNVLSRLFGTRVVREERIQAGHGRCVFRVRADEPRREDGFVSEEPLPTR